MAMTHKSVCLGLVVMIAFGVAIGSEAKASGHRARRPRCAMQMPSVPPANPCANSLPTSIPVSTTPGLRRVPESDNLTLIAVPDANAEWQVVQARQVN